MDIKFLFEINAGLHSFAAVIGLAAVFLAEFFYLKTIRAGAIDENDSKKMKLIYKILRWSMVVLVFTGFMFFVKWRLGFGGAKLFFNEAFWAKYAIVAILLINAVLMQAKKISLKIGAPLSLVSWSAAYVLGRWHPKSFSFLGVMAVYVATVIIISFILEAIRGKLTNNQ